FYFIEMNTRIQVEHPVTEMSTGIDLVNEQLRGAAGRRRSVTQDESKGSGHAIDCRFNAEHPETCLPSASLITYFHPPGRLSVRFEWALVQGYRLPRPEHSLHA
ncbi:acetyl-CoA carboxylase biotin carboxylase subunit, partial [Methylobacterium sp. J-090]|nr:acetyl-CoA carboxylase biotin carboxylase subunit [Methylobacterium sp. J-090]